MSLSELIAGVEAHRKTLTVYNTDPGDAATLRDRFSERNVAVESAHTPEGPESYAVLHRDGEFLTAAAVEDVLARDTGATERPILDHIDQTTFTSYDTGQMTAASREIEDRAWRIGAGQLHAGFQTVSVIGSQLDAYEQLASREGLDVHAYGYPDAEVPDHEGFTVHVERSREIRESWFVVYDGDGDDASKCALLAEEREPRSFYGFWTYDPDTVDWIVDHLRSAYGLLEPT
jgi:DICT domain-containing protein